MTAPTTYTTRNTCRCCGLADLVDVFSLGEQYVSDFVPRDKITSGHRCPIDLVLCRGCTLLQQRHTAPQDFLYTRHYWYRSGVTATMREALADVARAAERLVDLRPGDVVLDIGSNDGTLLRAYTAPGIVRVGVEPATNLAEEGRVGLDLFVNDFWSEEAYLKGMWSLSPEKAPRATNKAKIITACGMMYDLEDPSSFIRDVAKVLAPDGVFIAQLMCLRQMMASRDVGNLCHEHLEFYTLRSLEALLGRHGLEVFDVEENSVNGGSYRLFSRHKRPMAWLQADPTGGLDRVICATREEARGGLNDPDALRQQFADWQTNRDRVGDFIEEEALAGKTIWVYGASTKGNVILQWLGMNETYIEAAADRSPEKHGLYTVGTGIPIRSEEEFRAARPDYALVLPWGFLPEFVQRERAWLEGGGRFLVPLPEFRVVGKEAL